MLENMPNRLPLSPPKIPAPPFLLLGGLPKICQNLNVSSAAALTTLLPSGLCAMCNTLAVCPFNSWIFVMLG